MKENSPPEEGIESHPRHFKGLKGCFHKWRFGIEIQECKGVSVEGLRRHGWEWVCASAWQHDTNGKVGFYVAIICYGEWNDWFNPDLNWPGTSDAWWHFLPSSVANVLQLRRTERRHNILVFYLVGKTPHWNMCYVFRLLTAVSFFTGGTDMFVELYSLYF